MEYLNWKFWNFTLKKISVPWYQFFYLECYACTKHFAKNWLISPFYLMSRFELIFSGVKLLRKISKNQLPIIFEPNVKNENKFYFWNDQKIFNNEFVRNNSAKFFLRFSDCFRYAWADISALWFQGLTLGCTRSKILENQVEVMN
jgi:hypothetical protein